MRKLNTHDTVAEMLVELFDGQIEVLKFERGKNALCRFRCRDCEREWEAMWRTVKRSKGCGPCLRKAATTTEVQAAARVAEKHGASIRLISYGGKVGTHDSTFQCAEGHEWIQSVWNIANGYSCAQCSGMVAYTAQTARQAVNERHGGAIRLVDFKPDGKKFSTFRCTEGHEWETHHGGVIGGRGCSRCSGFHTRTLDDMLEEIEQTYDGGIEMVSYGGSRVSLSSVFRCAEGHEWESSVQTVVGKANGCSKCSGYAPITEAEFIERVERTHGDSVVLVEWGGGIGCSSVFRCSEGHEWATRGSHVSDDGTGCPRCSGTGKLTDAEAKQKVSDRHDGKVRMIERGDTQKDVCLFRCSEGHEWETYFDYVAGVSSGGCPECRKSGPISAAERKLFERLAEKAEGWEITHNTLDRLFFDRSDLPGGRQRFYPDILAEKNGVKVVVEHDGIFWHDSADDRIKTFAAEREGWVVLRVVQGSVKEFETFTHLGPFDVGYVGGSVPSEVVDTIVSNLERLSFLRSAE